eukprot:gene5549-4004_t
MTSLHIAVEPLTEHAIPLYRFFFFLLPFPLLFIITLILQIITIYLTLIYIYIYNLSPLLCFLTSNRDAAAERRADVMRRSLCGDSTAPFPLTRPVKRRDKVIVVCDEEFRLEQAFTYFLLSVALPLLRLHINIVLFRHGSSTSSNRREVSPLQAQQAQAVLDVPLVVFVHSAAEATPEEAAGCPRVQSLAAVRHGRKVAEIDVSFASIKGRTAQREAFAAALSHGQMHRVVLVHEVQEGTAAYDQLVEAVPGCLAVPRAHLLPSRSAARAAPGVLAEGNFTAVRLIQCLQQLLRIPFGGATVPASAARQRSDQADNHSAKEIMQRLREHVEMINSQLAHSACAVAPPSRPSTAPSANKSVPSPSPPKKSPAPAPAPKQALPAAPSPPSPSTGTSPGAGQEAPAAEELDTKKRPISSVSKPDAEPVPQRQKPEFISLRCTLPTGGSLTVERLRPSSSTIRNDVRPRIQEALGHDAFDIVKVSTPPQRLHRDTDEGSALQDIGITASSSVRVVVKSTAPGGPPTATVPAHETTGMPAPLKRMMGIFQRERPSPSQVPAPVVPAGPRSHSARNIHTLDEILAAQQPPAAPGPRGGHTASPGGNGAMMHSLRRLFSAGKEPQALQAKTMMKNTQKRRCSAPKRLGVQAAGCEIQAQRNQKNSHCVDGERFTISPLGCITPKGEERDCAFEGGEDQNLNDYRGFPPSQSTQRKTGENNNPSRLPFHSLLPSPPRNAIQTLVIHHRQLYSFRFVVLPTKIPRVLAFAPGVVHSTRRGSMARETVLTGLVVGGKYKVGVRIGGGTFGELYLGTSISSGNAVAIKVEKSTASYPQLAREARLYAVLAASRDRRQNKRLERIATVKMNTSVQELCRGLPFEFAAYLHYTRSLPFEACPDYAYLRSLFRSLFIRYGFEDDGVYDWTAMTDREIRKSEDHR